MSEGRNLTNAMNGEDPEPTPPATGMSPMQFMMMAIALFVFVYLLINFAGDAASWHLAAAEEHNLLRDRDDTNGELKKALESIDAAIAARPDDLSLLQQRSQWRRDAGDYEGALADLALIESLLPTGEVGFQLRINLLQQRGLIYQRQGKHAEAVAEQTQMIDRLNARYDGAKSLDSYRAAMSLALNNRAYFRAIGEIELEGALQDIEKSMQLAGYEEKSRHLGSLDEAVKLDTRGYVRYLLKDYDGALADLERAILLLENAFSLERMRVMNEMRTMVDRRPIQLHFRTYEENLSVLYHHRGQIYEQLGRRFDAATDFDRAIRLGYNPKRGVL